MSDEERVEGRKSGRASPPLVGRPEDDGRPPALGREVEREVGRPPAVGREVGRPVEGRDEGRAEDGRPEDGRPELGRLGRDGRSLM